MISGEEEHTCVNERWGDITVMLQGYSSGGG